MQNKMTRLVMPGLSETESAERLLKDLPQLWMEANLNGKRRVLLALLDASTRMPYFGSLLFAPSSRSCSSSSQRP